MIEARPIVLHLGEADRPGTRCGLDNAAQVTVGTTDAATKLAARIDAETCQTCQEEGTTMTTTPKPRHSTRCQTPGCNRFVTCEGVTCSVCYAAYSNGCGDMWQAREKDKLKELEIARAETRAAREAAVNDHAAHEAEMAQLRREHVVAMDARLKHLALQADARHKADAVRAECEAKADVLRAELRAVAGHSEQHQAAADRLARWLGYAIGAAVVATMAAIAGWVR